MKGQKRGEHLQELTIMYRSGRNAYTYFNSNSSSSSKLWSSFGFLMPGKRRL